MSRRVYLPPTLWALAILILCGWPGDQLPEITFWQWLRWDKIAHLVLFGIQSFLLLRAFSINNNNVQVSRQAVWLSISLTIFYGILVEILQEVVFLNRNGDSRDALANALGALSGLLAYRRFYR